MAEGPPTLTRIRRAGVGLALGIVVAWAAWPLVGLLSAWLLLPPDFPPLALGLLVVMVASAGVAGWFYDPGETEDDPRG